MWPFKKKVKKIALEISASSEEIIEITFNVSEFATFSEKKRAVKTMQNILSNFENGGILNLIQRLGVSGIKDKYVAINLHETINKFRPTKNGEVLIDPLMALKQNPNEMEE